MTMAQKQQIKAGGRAIAVSNLDKVLYPEAGFTKGQMIDYYIRISPVLLPHLKDRPITLKRYPEGVDGGFFYEKQCPEHRPGWVRTARVPKSEGGEINYCVINSLASLAWAANLANLEVHTFLHRAPKIEQPLALAFDLDPGLPADILDCCRVALRIKQIFDVFKLKAFAKTSGSKGLQVYVPLNTPANYEKTKSFALAVAEKLASESPDYVVSKMQRALRPGKVLVDWSQNDAHKTTVCVYSLRARKRPFVSTPLHWEEVASALNKKDARSLEFQAKDVLRRVAKEGDLFAPVLKCRQRLPSPDLLRGAPGLRKK